MGSPVKRVRARVAATRRAPETRPVAAPTEAGVAVSSLALPSAAGPGDRSQPVKPFFFRFRPVGRSFDAEGPRADVPIRLAGRFVTGAARTPDPGRSPPEEETAVSGVVSDPANHHLPDRGRSVTCEMLRERPAPYGPGPSTM